MLIIRKFFDDLVKIDIAAAKSFQDFDKNKIKMHLLSKINHQEKPKSIFRLSNYLKIAAVLVVMLGSWFIFQNKSNTNYSEEVFNRTSDAITLEMEDGSIQELDMYTNTEIKNTDGTVVGSSNKNVLVYNGASTVHQKILFSIFCGCRICLGCNSYRRLQQFRSK